MADAPPITLNMADAIALPPITLNMADALAPPPPPPITLNIYDCRTSTPPLNLNMQLQCFVKLKLLFYSSHLNSQNDYQYRQIP